MKRAVLILISMTALLGITASCSSRCMRTATDVTPGNCGEKMDWRYGATDIRIQTTKVTRQLMDRWYSRAAENGVNGCKPRIIITEIDNRTDTFISTDIIRDIIEGVAINDGRFSIVVGDYQDERELDGLMCKVMQDPKYSNCSRLTPNQATAPQFLGKIRITKAVTSDRSYDYEDYRMTVTLYDIETQEAIDSAWDVLTKKVQA